MWENVKNSQNHVVVWRFHNETKPWKTFHCGITNWIFIIILSKADTEELYHRWITSLQQGISSALHETIHKERTSHSSENSKLQWEDSDNEDNSAHSSQNPATSGSQKRRGLKPSAKQILLIPGNENCADCGKLNEKFGEHSVMFPEVLFRCENVGQQRDFVNFWHFLTGIQPFFKTKWLCLGLKTQ